MTVIAGGAQPAAVAHAAVATLVLAAIAYTLPVYLYYVHPLGYVMLIAERSYGEWATFFAWMSAFVVASAAIVRRPALRTVAFVSFALGCAVMASDDIGLVRGVFAALGAPLEQNAREVLPSDYTAVDSVVAVWGVAMPLVPFGTKRWRGALRRLAAPLVPLYVAPMFLVALLYLTARGIPILRLSDAPLCSRELGELYLGIGALLIAMQFLRAGDSTTRPRVAPPVPTICSAVAAVVVCAAFATQLFASERMLAPKLTHFAASVYPARGQSAQALMLFDSIEAHRGYASSASERWSRGGPRLHHAAQLLRSGRRSDAAAMLASALAAPEVQSRARD